MMFKKLFNIGEKISLAILLLIITVLFVVHQWSIFLYGQQYFIHGLIFVEMGLLIVGVVWSWITFRGLKIDMQRKDDVKGLSFLAFGVIIVGLVAVLYKLGLGIVVDEQYQLEAVRGILRTGKPVFPTGLLYSRGIAYSYFAALFAWLNGGEVTEFVGRLPSVIYYLGTALVIWFSGKRIFNQRVAFFALVVFCWSIPMIFFGKFARGYMGLSFFSLLGAVSFYRAVYLGENTWIKWFWVSALIAPLHHKPGVWLWLLALFFLFKRAVKGKFKSFIYLLIAVSFLAIIGWVTSLGYGFWFGVIRRAFFRLNWWPNLFYWIYYPFVFPFLILICIIGYISNLKFFIKNKVNYFYYVIFSLIILLSFFNAPFRPRYILWVFPILALVFGFSLDRLIILLSDLFNKRYAKMFFLTVTVLLLYNLSNFFIVWRFDYGASLPFLKVQGMSLFMYPDYRTPALYVKERAEPDDLVISVSGEMMHYFYLKELLDYTFVYKLRNGNKRTDVKYILEVDKLLSLISENKSRRKVWLITEYRIDPGCKFWGCVRGPAKYMKLRDFLEENKDRVVYVGKDNVSKVYLF